MTLQCQSGTICCHTASYYAIANLESLLAGSGNFFTFALGCPGLQQTAQSSWTPDNVPKSTALNYYHEHFCPWTKGHQCGIFCQEVTFLHFNLQLNLCDTAGLEQHATLTRSHYLLSQAVLIVYSVNDEESLSQAIEILKFAKIHAQGACFILITNKIDLEPTFTEDELRSSIPENAFVLKFRTSALTGEGIQDMLHKLASHLNKKATPMKSIGRSCFGNCNDTSASYNGDAGVVRLQFEDVHQRRRRRRKCCSS